MFASLILAAALLQTAPEPPPQPQQSPPPVEAPAKPRWSTRSRLVDLMANPDTFPIMQKHLPRIIAQIENSTGITIPLDFTLDDFLHVPEAQITQEDLDAINAELAKL
jgi:hypothetical protein